MEIQFTTQVFKGGTEFVAHTRELDISSCGGTEQKALENLKEAVWLFLTRPTLWAPSIKSLKKLAFSSTTIRWKARSSSARRGSPYPFLCCMSKKLSPVSYKEAEEGV
jgi:hypothetical protein